MHYLKEKKVWVSIVLENPKVEGGASSATVSHLLHYLWSQ